MPTAMSRSKAPTHEAIEMPASDAALSAPTIEYVAATR
jgi:hypothetical protein